MRELDLKLTSYECLENVLVKIDGKPFEMKKEKSGTLGGHYRTESEIVKIEVFKMLDVGGPLWFIVQLFFFVITLFGLIGIHHKEKCFVIDFEIEVELEEHSELTLQLNPPKQDERAIEFETSLAGNEISNMYLFDKEAKRTLKLLKIVKIILALAIIATVIALFASNK